MGHGRHKMLLKGTFYLQRLSICNFELASMLIPYKDNGLFLRLQIIRES